MNAHVPVRPHTRRKPVRPSLIDNKVHVKLREEVDAVKIDFMTALLAACVAESVAEYGEE